MGIVQWAVPRADIAAETQRIVRRIASLPLPALRVAKELIASHGAGHEAGYAMERELGGQLLCTPEANDRITAFIRRNNQ